MVIHDEYGIKDISDYRPVTRCYRPIRLYNKYLGDYVFADCRKCPACLHKYSVELTQRVSDECKQHLFSVFFTLTYDNEHLPVYIRQCPHVWKLNRNYPRDGTGLYLFGDFKDYHYPQKLSTECFGSVCKEDIQLWLKRLRRKIDYVFKDLDYEERKIRYFISSEYGPTTKRPHYHGILWCDSRQIADSLARFIRETWKMCDTSRIDVQFVSGSAPAYVAKYVNGFAHLDEVLQFKFTRPWHLASKDPVIGSFVCDYSQVFDLLVNRNIERLRVADGKIESSSYVPISYSFISRHFPTCQGFSLSTDEYQYLVFKKYERGDYKKVYDRLSKKYIESPLRGYAYLAQKDSFKYTDYRFYKKVAFYCSRVWKFPKRDKSGAVIGTYECSFSAREIIHLYKLLYSDYYLYIMNSSYRLQEILCSSQEFTYERLLRFYPYVWRNLPLTLSPYDLNKKFHELGDISYYDVLSYFGFAYDDIYKDYQLKFGFVDLMFNDELDKRFRSDMISKILESDRKKKFSELYLGFNKF